MKRAVFYIVVVAGLIIAGSRGSALAADDNSFIAMDQNGQTISVAWQDNTTGALYLAQSTDQGITFDTFIEMTQGVPGTHTSPVLAMDNPGNLYAVWECADNGTLSDICFGRMLKGNTALETGVIPVDTALNGNANQTQPKLRVTSNGAVYVAWANNGNNEGIYLAVDEDQGEGLWSLSAESLWMVSNTTAAAAPQNPDFALDASGRNKYFVWNAVKDGERVVYFNQLDLANSRVHAADIRLNDLGGAHNPAVAVRPNAAGGSNPNIFVVWQQTSGSASEILLDKSADGSAWGGDIAVNEEAAAPRIQSDPQIGADSNGDIFVVWEEIIDANPDVYASYSLDRGLTFKTSLLINNEATDGRQDNPSLAITADGNDFCVSWTDQEDGSIYFNRNTIYDDSSAQETFINSSLGGTAEAKSTSSIAQAEVIIPPGALKMPLTVSISRVLIPPPFFNTDTQINKAVDFSPSGTEFDAPVTIKIPYMTTDLSNADVTDESLLRIYYYNLKTLLWERIDDVSVDTINQVVSAQVNHFSIFGLGAISGGAGAGSYYDKGNCFIATAAYGSSDAPELKVLRGFRDDYLMKQAWGRGLVSLYYSHSPRWAAFIADKPAARALVRVLLKPVVYSIEKGL